MMLEPGCLDARLLLSIGLLWGIAGLVWGMALGLKFGEWRWRR